MIKVDTNLHKIAGKSVVQRDDPKYKNYRRKWVEWPEHGIIGAFPLHLDIEPTSACNLRCPFCATTYNKYKSGFMSELTWKMILDEAGENSLYSLKFTFRGEPLLHPDLPRMVAYAKEVGVMDVYFNTNALLLDEEMITKLIESGLDRISISFEGSDKSVYETYRVGSNYDTVVSNIENLMKIKKKMGVKKPLVRIQSVLIPEMKERLDEYARFWKERADEVSYLDMKDEEGNPNHRGIQYPWACPQLWQRLTITWNGIIIPCVHDIYHWMELGKVGDVTIKDAWNSIKENHYRSLHWEGKAHEIDACDRCPLRENEIHKIQKNG